MKKSLGLTANTATTVLFYAFLLLCVYNIALFATVKHLSPDVGYALWKIRGASRFVDLASALPFGQGIILQFFFLNKIGLTLLMAQSIAVLCTIASAVLSIWLLRRRFNADYFVIALVCFLFLNNRHVIFFGSWAVIVYAETLLAGVLCYWMSLAALDSEHELRAQPALLMAAFCLLGCFIDIRLALYIAVFYVMSFIASLTGATKRQTYRFLITGGLLSFFCLVPAVWQLYVVPYVYIGAVPDYSADLTFPPDTAYGVRSVGIYLLRSATRLFSLRLDLGDSSIAPGAVLLIGFTLGIARCLARRERPLIVLIGGVGLSAFVLFVGGLLRLHPFGNFRYCLQLLPLVCIGAALGFQFLWEELSRRFQSVGRERPGYPIVAVAALVALIGLQAYRVEVNTRTIASENGNFSRLLDYLEAHKQLTVISDYWTGRIVNATGLDLPHHAILISRDSIKYGKTTAAERRSFIDAINGNREVLVVGSNSTNDRRFAPFRSALQEAGFSLTDTIAAEQTDWVTSRVTSLTHWKRQVSPRAPDPEQLSSLLRNHHLRNRH